MKPALELDTGEVGTPSNLLQSHLLLLLHNPTLDSSSMWHIYGTIHSARQIQKLRGWKHSSSVVVEPHGNHHRALVLAIER
jgi:hypothetical protein